MRFNQQLTRRRFLGTVAATAGAGMLSGPIKLEAGNAAPPANCASTDAFWYRLQSSDRYIDSQRGKRAFAYAEGMLFLSKDNGRTWPYRLAFPDAQRITFSHILKNGNIVFATSTQLYLSTDNLKSYRPITVKAQDGSDYLPHRPQNPENPGWYFHTLPGEISWNVNGREMMVWGNYCNVLGGASPVNIYYSTDGGRTVKIAYAFGQNPHFRDNGSPGGGSAGTLLGNPGNPVLARHVHAVSYNPAERAFYACTGDLDRGSGHECHWLRGTYDARKDRWDWRVLVSSNSNSRYKCGGISFVKGLAYWISDANGERSNAYGDLGYDRGIFRCAPADIPYPEKHTLLYNPEVESGNMIVQDGFIIASHCCPASPMDTGFIVSTDLGKTWAQYDLKELGKRSPTRFHAKNSDGWFRVDLRTGWIERGEVLFIKPKSKAAKHTRGSFKTPQPPT